MKFERLQSIDAIRGAVMIIMALDHVREFLHREAARFRPEDLTQTTPEIFFTRWITHFCAPVFMFYAGTSAFLWAQRGKTKGELSRFLLTRGLWLVVLELTAMRFAFYFNLTTAPLVLTVLWAIGWSMVALAGLVWLPFRAIASLSIAIIVLHNALDGVQAGQFGAAGWMWKVLHQVAPMKAGGLVIIPGYSLLPWAGVMAAGYCMGRAFLPEWQLRRRVLLRAGAAATAMFIAIRLVNWYGDPSRWVAQSSAMYSVMSFLNCTKYPPSLLFILMTIGPALLATAGVDGIRFTRWNPLIVFGRVPLFYFLAHLALIHLVAAVLFRVQTGNAALFTSAPPGVAGPNPAVPANYGYSLWAVYLAWIVIVAMLYPVCRWFAGVKERRRDGWLSYL